MALCLAKVKFGLAFLLCSYIAETCLPPHIYETEFKSEYDCLIVGYLEFKPGFFFIPEKEIMKWVTLSSNSLVITPLDTNLVSAIIGLYFGGSLVKK